LGTGIERALRVGVEGLDAFDVVVEQIEAVWQRTSHREEIDQSAAHAELAGRDDLRDVPVTGEGELGAQRVDVEPRPLLQEERECREKLLRREPIERRRRRDDQYAAFSARDVVERGEPLRDQVLVRREMVIRKRLPVREERDGKAGSEPGQLVGEALGIERIRRDDREQSLLPGANGGELRERERIRRSHGHASARLLAGRRQTRDELGQRREHRNGRGESGGRGLGGVSARCGSRGVGQRRGRRSRRPDGGVGRRHVQLQIEGGLYVGRRICRRRYSPVSSRRLWAYAEAWRQPRRTKGRAWRGRVPSEPKFRTVDTLNR
jgi:hypothetical protein